MGGQDPKHDERKAQLAALEHQFYHGHAEAGLRYIELVHRWEGDVTADELLHRRRCVESIAKGLLHSNNWLRDNPWLLALGLAASALVEGCLLAKGVKDGSSMAFAMAPAIFGMVFAQPRIPVPPSEKSSAGSFVIPWDYVTGLAMIGFAVAGAALWTHGGPVLVVVVIVVATLWKRVSFSG